MMRGSKIRDLGRDFFQRGQRNAHEAFPGRSVQVFPFGFGQVVPLHICVAIRRNDCGRASPAFAELLHRAVLRYDLLYFHGIFWFCVNQNHAFWFTQGEEAECSTGEGVAST